MTERRVRTPRRPDQCCVLIHGTGRQRAVHLLDAVDGGPAAARHTLRPDDLPGGKHGISNSPAMPQARYRAIVGWLGEKLGEAVSSE